MIWDGVVWVTNATEDGTRLSVVAVEPVQGKVVRDLTIFEIAKPQFCHAFNSYASSTPVIEAGRLYVHYGSAGTAWPVTVLRVCSTTRAGWPRARP